MSEQNDSTQAEPNIEGPPAGPLELEQMKRPLLAEVAARYDVKITPGMSNLLVVAAIKAAAGYVSQQPPDERQQGQIQYVMMRRISDGDGPHPIHPDEVDNYRLGDWVEVDPQQ